jgi:hypothetical protein
MSLGSAAFLRRGGRNAFGLRSGDDGTHGKNFGEGRSDGPPDTNFQACHCQKVKS